MDNMYHFTSEENWNEIKQLGKILPLTTIQWVYNPNDFTNKTRSICSARRYIVGLPEPHHKGWIEYGLWDEIFRLIACKVL